MTAVTIKAATAMTDKLTDDQKEKINVQIPAARMGTPEEIAAAAVSEALPEVEDEWDPFEDD